MTDQDYGHDQAMIARAEAGAQAMVDELERLVEQLRRARAEAPRPDLSAGRLTEPVGHAAAMGATPLAPQPPSPRPRRGRLAQSLGLAAVALVGIVGAAAVTVARETSGGSDGAGGMEPLPFARTASGTSVSGHGGTALPLGSAARVAATGPAASATPSGGASGAGGKTGRHRRHERFGSGDGPGWLDGDAYADQPQDPLLAEALKQAEEAEAQELQALAQSFQPTPPVPQLPAPYTGQHRKG